MFGTAVKVRDLSPRAWHKGSALYKIHPPCEFNRLGHICNGEYVIVAVTPMVRCVPRSAWSRCRCSDPMNGKPETAIFQGRKSGRLFVPNGGIEKGDWNNLGVHVEGMDHQAALAELQGGYRIVEQK